MTEKTINSRSYVKYRIPFEKILDEITIALRNNISDRQNRAVSFTESFAGDGSTKRFELTNDLDSKNRHTVKNVKSVTIDGVEQTQWEDYSVKYRSDDTYAGYLSFTNPPSSGAAISLTGEKTYTHVVQEYPRMDLTPASYPRISVQMGQAVGNERDTKYDWDEVQVSITISVVDINRNYTDNLSREVWRYIKNNRRNFYYFDFIVQPKLMPFSTDPDNQNSFSYIQSHDYAIVQLWEQS